MTEKMLTGKTVKLQTNRISYPTLQVFCSVVRCLPMLLASFSVAFLLIQLVPDSVCVWAFFCVECLCCCFHVSNIHVHMNRIMRNFFLHIRNMKAQISCKVAESIFIFKALLKLIFSYPAFMQLSESQWLIEFLSLLMILNILNESDPPLPCVQCQTSHGKLSKVSSLKTRPAENHSHIMKESIFPLQ